MLNHRRDWGIISIHLSSFQCQIYWASSLQILCIVVSGLFSEKPPEGYDVVQVHSSYIAVCKNKLLLVHFPCCCEWLFSLLSLLSIVMIWLLCMFCYFTVTLCWCLVFSLFFLSFFCFRLHLLGCLGTVVWFAMHDLVVVFSTPGTRHPSSPRPVPKRHMSAPKLDASAETWIWSVDVNLLPEAAGSRKPTAEWACQPLSDASPTAFWRNFWSSWTTLPSTWGRWDLHLASHGERATPPPRKMSSSLERLVLV